MQVPNTWGVARRWALIALALAPIFFIALSGSRHTVQTLAHEASARADTAATATHSAWHKRWWIDKAARLLRGGEGLGPDDDIQALMGLSKEAILRRFMEDVRFGNSILDFNLFFLGFKSDALKAGAVYDRTVFDFPNAVAAAQALLTGGDYFKLFDFEGPFYMAPLRSEPSEDPPLPADVGLSPAQLRKKAMGEIEAELATVAASVKTVTGMADVCRKVEKLAERVEELTQKLHRAFDDAEIFALIRGEVLAAPLDALAKLAEKECAKRGASGPARRKLAAGVQRAQQRIKRAFDEIATFEPAVYRPKSVLEFRRLDLSALPTRQKWLSFGFEQGMALGNSSTNFNRKRSAYVLKRFFCDDLIPIGFESPQEHIGGAHGSQTTCFACHHKLDPMAGFFRSHGAYFFDYSRSDDIIFDDLASKERKLYESLWKAANKAERTWNIGYIRSSRWQTHNSYGSSMADLSRIVRSAPEVKRCLMRRLHEYVVAEHQTIDSGYLDYLTRTFEAEAATDPSGAMKSAIVRILQSSAFEQPDADPRRCYDLAPGATVGPGPPCRVSSILTKNCGQCHHAGGEKGAERLDVHSWIVAPDGKQRSFRHVDADTQQLSAQDSLARVIERLSSFDQKTRMPLGRVMPNDERQELFLWAQEELAAISKQVSR